MTGWLAHLRRDPGGHAIAATLGACAAVLAVALLHATGACP